MDMSPVWLAEIGSIVFAIAGVCAAFGIISKKTKIKEWGALVAAIIGPVTLFLCWLGLSGARETDTVFWSRLMAGDAAELFAVGALGLIAGSGLAVGALSLGNRFSALCVGAFFLALSWIVLLLHPTPHYVPIPSWLDKMVWFCSLVGGAAVCIVVYLKFRDLLSRFAPLLSIVGALALLSLLTIAAHNQARQPLDLGALEPEQRLRRLDVWLAIASRGKAPWNRAAHWNRRAADRKKHCGYSFRIPARKSQRNWGFVTIQPARWRAFN